MDNRPTRIDQSRQFTGSSPGSNRLDELANQRLSALLKANAETAREKSLYDSEQERFEAELIRNPMSSEQAYAYFGLMVGAFAPAAIFLKLTLASGSFRSEELWVLGILGIVNMISAAVGFFSGKLIGKIVRETEKMAWPKMLVLLPFIGILWGIISGGAGGIIIFIVGAVVGAGLGALVGSVTLPLFTLFHRLLKKGDLISRNQFLPIAFGVSFVICGFILGL